MGRSGTLSSAQPDEVAAPRIRRGFWILGLVVTGSALALGSVHVTVLMCVAVGLAIACAVAWSKPVAVTLMPPVKIVLAVGGGLTAYTAFQLIPWPAGLLAWVAPETADVWSRALRPLGEVGPSWIPITLDPNATRVEVLRGLCYLCAFVAALRFVRSREEIALLQTSVILSALLVIAATIAHPLMGADKVYGLYEPKQWTLGTRIGPFLNTNHLAGYVNIALCLTFGMAFSRVPAFPRPALFALSFFFIGVQLWNASRGGIFSMIFGLALIGWLRTRRPFWRSRIRLGVWVPAVVSLIGVIMLTIGLNHIVLERLAHPDFAKIGMALQGWRVVRAFPIFGIGRGAFESVFPAFNTNGEYIVFTHPENWVMQWATEWGPGAALMAAGGLAYALRPGPIFANAQTAVGPWTALVVSAIHNLVDFNSEMPAVGVALAVCAACILRQEIVFSPKTTSSEGSVPVCRVLWPHAISLTAIAGVFLVTPAIAHGLREDRDEVRRLVLGGADRAEFSAANRAAMLRHPAEPYLPYAGAWRATRTHDESVVPWIARTLERAPVYAPAHVTLARALTAVSPSQARLEYRIAMEQLPPLRYSVIPDAVPVLVDTYDDARALTPAGIHESSVLDLLVDLLADTKPATAALLNEDQDRASPGSLAVRKRTAIAAIADVRAGPAAPWCDNDRVACMATAWEASRNFLVKAPKACASLSIPVELAAYSGEIARANDLITTALETATDREDCFVRLESIVRRTGQMSLMPNLLEASARAGCSTNPECVDRFLWIAAVEERDGHYARALSFFRKASDRDPDRPDILSQLAANAATLELHMEASAAYGRLAELQPQNHQWIERRDQERDKALQLPSAAR